MGKAGRSDTAMAGSQWEEADHVHYAESGGKEEKTAPKRTCQSRGWC